VYSSRARGFSAATDVVAPVFASRAAIALAHAEQVRNLRRAIGTRQVIGEAVGILMERHRLTAGQAFERLITASRHRHVKLRELATRLTETSEDPDPPAT
jgi:AmiR/NasT family two-component response regulator